MFIKIKTIEITKTYYDKLHEDPSEDFDGFLEELGIEMLPNEQQSKYQKGYLEFKVINEKKLVFGTIKYGLEVKQNKRKASIYKDKTM